MRRYGAITRAAGLLAGDHVCWTYASDAEHQVTLASYFAEGLDAQQRILYLAPMAKLPIAPAVLRGLGHDPEDLIRAGTLMLAPIEEVYPVDGGFDSDATLRTFRDLVERSIHDGYLGLRAAAECGGLLNDPSTRTGWPAYELRADLLAATLPLVGMCAYDLRVADPSSVELLRSVHPLHLAKGPCSEQLFHVFGSGRGDLRVGGEIDFTCSDLVRALVDPCLPDLDEACLDLTHLRFADVTGVRTIAMIAQRMAEIRSPVTLRGASPTFRRVWTLANLDRLVPVVMT